MSVQAMSWAFSVRGISPSEKLVLLSLANYANAEARCWPKQETIALETELSSRTVWAALKRLSDVGIIVREARKRSDGTRMSDVFTLNMGADPVANLVKSTRKLCENQSQMLPNPPARFAEQESPIEPLIEPTTTIDASAKEDWSSLLEEAKAAAGPALDLTSPSVHHAAHLTALVRPRSGEPCTRSEVLDAVRMVAARAVKRGKPIRSWQWITEDAIGLRDIRINATAPPVSANAVPRQASLSERIDEQERRVKQRVIDELAREDEARGRYDTNHRSDHRPSGALPNADHGRRAASELVAGLVSGLTGLSHRSD